MKKIIRFLQNFIVDKWTIINQNPGQKYVVAFTEFLLYSFFVCLEFLKMFKTLEDIVLSHHLRSSTCYSFIERPNRRVLLKLCLYVGIGENIFRKISESHILNQKKKKKNWRHCVIAEVLLKLYSSLNSE